MVRDKLMKLGLVVAFALSLLLVVYSLLIICTSLRVVLLTAFFVVIGWLNYRLFSERNDIILNNVLLVILLMFLTRITYVIGTSDLSVLDPLNIFVCFIIYSVIANFTSYIFWIWREYSK